MKKSSLTSVLKWTLLVAAIVYVGDPDSVGIRYWNISFDIVDGTPPEHVSLSFFTTDTPEPSETQAFFGYLVDYATLTGFQGEYAVEGLAPYAFYNVNDNLVNPEANNPFDPGGLAYQEKSTGDQYQVFYDGQLQACSQTCYMLGPVSPFNVINFTYTEVK